MTGRDRTDEELYQNFIMNEDKESMHALFERYCEPLTFFINGIVNNEDDAQEIMMDCFAVVVAGSSRFTGKRGAGFKTWLYAIATKRSYHFLRKNRTTGVFGEESDKTVDERTLPENVLLKDEKNRELYNALNHLPDDQHMALYLKFFEDMEPDQIARVMNKSVRQIYKLTDKGKSRLRDLIDKNGSEGLLQWDI